MSPFTHSQQTEPRCFTSKHHFAGSQSLSKRANSYLITLMHHIIGASAGGRQTGARALDWELKRCIYLKPVWLPGRSSQTMGVINLHSSRSRLRWVTCNVVEGGTRSNERVATHAHDACVPGARVERLIKMCNRFTDPDMPLEQKVIIHTV